MSFDAVFDKIGHFGIYQKYIVLLSAINGLFITLIFQGTVYLLSVPDHRCAIPGYDNDTFAVRSSYHQELINRSIPENDACHVFPVDVQYDFDNRPINATPNTCDSWVYDKSSFDETLASKLNLVCDRKIYKSNAQMLFFSGVLAGSFITGILSDRFGRRIVVCGFTTLLIGSSIALAWTQNYLYLAVFNFITGMVSAGNFMTLFVIGMEYVGPERRKDVAIFGQYCYSIGGLILALFGYLFRNWFHLQLACSFPGILMLLYWVLLPESPRWLFSRGRFEEAEKVTRTIAKYNKTVLPDGFVQKLSKDITEEPTAKIWHLFSTRRLAQRTLIIFFNWFVVGMAYYGLMLNSGNLGDSIFLSYTLNVIADFPGPIATQILINRTGRRPYIIACMVICGLSCLSTVFSLQYGGPDIRLLTTVLAMLGKMGALAGFTTMYLYSAELYPTIVRNAGMGASSCMARVGSMVAPYIANLGNLVDSRFGKALPMLVFGVLALAAGLLDLLLPETLHKHLPETIEDADKFGRDDNKAKQAATVTIGLEEEELL